MRSPIPTLLLCAAAILTGNPLEADQLHLESGGVIETADWWIDGDNLLYRSAAGIVGIPRSLVLRIERTSVSEPPPTPAVTASPMRSTERTAERREQFRQQILEGTRALEDGDCETASDRFFYAMTLEPKAYAPRVQYAYCEIRMDHDSSALAAVLDGLVLHPEGAELHELLGDLRDREENLSDALMSWRRAFSIQPTDRVREKIEKCERDLNSRRDYEFARTSHFNLRYDGGVDEALAAEVSKHLEERFWELTKRYNHAPRQPITTLLYPNRVFREVTQSAEWVGGLYDGKIRVPLGGLSRLHRGARRVLTHELTHAVIHSKSHQRCPRWLHEGLAQISDGTRLTPARRRSVEEGLARLDNPANWAEQEFSYPMALSLVRWLERRRDFSHLVWLLDLLGEGQSIDQALQRVYGDDYAELCRRWAASVLSGSAE